MKITNGVLSEIFVPALKELGTKKVSGKVAYNCMRTLKSCGSLLESYQEARNNFILAHCEKKEDGRPLEKDGEYVFPDDQTKVNVIKELDELANTEVVVDVFPISAEELYDAEEVTAELMFKLMEFIKEPASALTKSIGENGVQNVEA